ncbi:hypothetical protein LA080_011258 [Diaporthe eres]|nr:hypothetical protein LA080_011258 [Diaporthe eres]
MALAQAQAQAQFRPLQTKHHSSPAQPSPGTAEKMGDEGRGRGDGGRTSGAQGSRERGILRVNAQVLDDWEVRPTGTQVANMSKGGGAEHIVGHGHGHGHDRRLGLYMTWARTWIWKRNGDGAAHERY